ncbi:MAG TPA: hypothetical protein VIT91_06090 [Chthoniobacterales bacterium]
MTHLTLRGILEEYMPDNLTHTEQDLNLPEQNRDPSAMLDSQVQKAQEQLLQLRRQQEVIEKQKRELEELSHRQDELERGKSEMIDKFIRALGIIERETADAEKRVETLRQTYDSFSEHLDVLEAINPKAWAQAELGKELTKAIGDVEEARTTFAKHRAKLAVDPVSPNQETAETSYPALDGDTERPFMYWFNAGLAFTLPILILGVVAIIVFIVHAPAK